MTGHGATPEQQRELIGVVKQARDGSIPEYFEAAYGLKFRFDSDIFFLEMPWINCCLK